MKPKFSLTTPVLAIIVTVTVVIAFTLLALVISLQQQDGNDDGKNGNVVEPTNPDSDIDYSFVGISQDDTIVLLNESEEAEVINIDQRKWLMPKWSPDSSLIAALGLTSEEGQIYNLFIYNLQDQRWRQATDYAPESGGISGFEWVDADTISYTQGKDGDVWLHRYSYEQEEIRKIFRSPGVVLDVFQDRETYLLEVSGETGQGALIYLLTDYEGTQKGLLTTEQFPSIVGIDSVIAGADAEEYFVTGVNANGFPLSYLWNISSSEIKLVEFDTDSDQTPKTLVSLCSAPSNLFYYYIPLLDLDNWEFGIASMESKTKVKLGDIPYQTGWLDLNSVQCYSDSVLFFDEDWYIGTSDALRKVDLIGTYNQLDMR